MMSPLFCLTGIGYVHDINEHDEGLIGKIKIIHQFCSSTKSDDIWINCIINDDQLIQLFSNFKNHLNMQKTIITQFAMRYAGFENFQNGMTQDDPNCIVFINGTLLNVEEYFINGEPFKNISEKIGHVVNA